MQAKRKPARPAVSAHSDSTEDHLERIADLVDQKGYARVSDVAEELGLTPSTVSNMVRRLAARGFVNYEKYRGFSLTAEGCSVAARIKVRHETLTEFFSLLGLEPETVEAEVEDIGHRAPLAATNAGCAGELSKVLAGPPCTSQRLLKVQREGMKAFASGAV